jgi:serine/threonine-protein kinase
MRPGDLVAGKYRVGRVIGQGGMGVVLEAEHTLLEERVALKFMHPQIAKSADAVTRFLQEARASSKIKNEHVARVLDVGSHEGVPYLVMEYLEGCDLSTLLLRERALPVALATAYVLQACEAIGRAHDRGLVHRDLKPANLFLAQRDGAEPILKVLDFGIAKAIGGTDVPSMTASNAFLGSPRYMAPEQVQNARDVDARADVWALGTILFELVAGRPAFDQGSVAALLVAICTQPAPSLEHVRPGVPAGFARIVADCLQIDRALRPQSIEELEARLSARESARPVKRASRTPWGWLAVAVLALGFGIGFRMMAIPRDKPAPLVAAQVAPSPPPPEPVVAPVASLAPIAEPQKPKPEAVKPVKPAGRGLYGSRH